MVGIYDDVVAPVEMVYTVILLYLPPAPGMYTVPVDGSVIAFKPRPVKASFGGDASGGDQVSLPMLQ